MYWDLEKIKSQLKDLSENVKFCKKPVRERFNRCFHQVLARWWKFKSRRKTHKKHLASAQRPPKAEANKMPS